MEKLQPTTETTAGMLGRSRAVKIAAVEGLHVSGRIAQVLDHAAERGLSGDETRAFIKALFAQK